MRAQKKRYGHVRGHRGREPPFASCVPLRCTSGSGGTQPRCFTVSSLRGKGGLRMSGAGCTLSAPSASEAASVHDTLSAERVCTASNASRKPREALVSERAEAWSSGEAAVPDTNLRLRGVKHLCAFGRYPSRRHAGMRGGGFGHPMPPVSTERCVSCDASGFLDFDQQGGPCRRLPMRG